MSDPNAKTYATPAGFEVQKTNDGRGYACFLEGGQIELATGFKTENMANIYLQGVVAGVLMGIKAVQRVIEPPMMEQVTQEPFNLTVN